jgi:Fe-S-cluster containining protein
MLKNVPALSKYDKGNGVCRHLKSNRCEIYEHRPVICNVQRMYDLYFHTMMDERTFIQENLMACLKLADGYPEIKSKIKAILLA